MESFWISPSTSTAPELLVVFSSMRSYGRSEAKGVSVRVETEAGSKESYAFQSMWISSAENRIFVSAGAYRALRGR